MRTWKWSLKDKSTPMLLRGFYSQTHHKFAWSPGSPFTSNTYVHQLFHWDLHVSSLKWTADPYLLPQKWIAKLISCTLPVSLQAWMRHYNHWTVVHLQLWKYWEAYYCCCAIQVNTLQHMTSKSYILLLYNKMTRNSHS